MNPINISSDFRITDFPNEGFTSVNNTIWCNYCGKTVNHTTKSIVQVHIKTLKHLLGKAAAGHRLEISINDSMWELMVLAFSSANVPISVFSNENVRLWIEYFMKHGEKLPLESALRDYQEKQVTNDLPDVILKCHGKDIILKLVEGVDPKNRQVLHTFVSIIGTFRTSDMLVSSCIVEDWNPDFIVDSVLTTLDLIHVQPNQLVVFFTNPLPCMGQAATRLKVSCSRLIHNMCWKYIINECAGEIRQTHAIIHTFITWFQGVIDNSNDRKEDLVRILREGRNWNNVLPTYDSTRWETWLESVIFLSRHLDDVTIWFDECVVGSTAPMFELGKLVKTNELRRQLVKLYPMALQVSTYLPFQKNDIYVIASDIWNSLQKIDQCHKYSNIPCGMLTTILQSNLAPFWRQIQHLDPRFADATAFDTLELPPVLANFSRVPIPTVEIAIYRNILQRGQYRNANVREFWDSLKPQLCPNLANVALSALCIPASMN